MPVDGDLSEPLRSLLEFESQKHDIPIRFQKTNLRYWRRSERFEPLLDVIVHTDPTPLPFAVPAGEALLKIRTAVFEREMPNPVGPTVGDELLPLAYLDGRTIVIPYDLEDLENLNGIPNPINRLWDLISTWAIPPAVEAIRGYDWAEERAVYTRAKLAALDQSIQKFQRDIRDNDYDIENHTSQVIELVRKNDELKTAVALFEAPGREKKASDAENEFTDLLRLVPGAFRKIDVQSDVLLAETGPIAIDLYGMRYDMGCYQVTIDLVSDRLTILNLTPGRIINGYHHPHVDSTGHPCLGNISLSLTKLLTLKQYPPALILIRRFLESYNSENPYLAIERWDPHHEGEDEEEEDDEDESCYEGSSTRDCVECLNSSCRFWEDRLDRCDEDSDLERCLDCQLCDAWRRRVEICWNDVVPRTECLEACSHDACPHWRNADDCQNSHDGEDCADCPNSDCDKRIETTSEEDEHDPCADRSAHP